MDFGLFEINFLLHAITRQSLADLQTVIKSGLSESFLHKFIFIPVMLIDSDSSLFFLKL